MKTKIPAMIVFMVVLFYSTMAHALVNHADNTPNEVAGGYCISGAITPATFKKVEALVKMTHPEIEYNGMWKACSYGFLRNISGIFGGMFESNVMLTWNGDILVRHKKIAKWTDLK